MTHYSKRKAPGLPSWADLEFYVSAWLFGNFQIHHNGTALCSLHDTLLLETRASAGNFPKFIRANPLFINEVRF